MIQAPNIKTVNAEQDNKDLDAEQIILINDILKYDYFPTDKIDRKNLRKAINQLEERIPKSTAYFFSIMIGFIIFIPTIYYHESVPATFLSINFTYYYFGFFITLFSLYCFGKWFLIPKFPFLGGKTDSFEARLENRIRNISSKSATFRLFRFIATIQPYKFKNIWWWSLVFSIFVASVEYIEKGRTLTLRFDDFDKRAFLDYGVSLSRGLLISVLAYIASNIIRELLTLRDKYSDTYTQVETLTNTISQSEGQLKSVIEGQTLANAFSSISNVLVQSNLGILSESFKSYKKTIEKQINVFHSMLSPTDPIINFWLISALSSYAKLTAENFNDRRTIITNFKLFAFFIKETIENLLSNKTYGPEQNCEVYSIVIFSPERYFNYKETNVQLNNDEKVRYNDRGWDEYLEVNRKAAINEKLSQHRHFISINASDEIFRRLKEEYDAEELISLRDTKVKKELDQKFIFEKSEKKLVKHKYENGEEQYICDKYSNDFQWHWDQVKNKANYELKQIRNVLDEVYHQKGCCKVIEITIDSDNIKDLSEFLFDEKTKKPIDYYAIRSKTTANRKGEWLVSFKGPYDHTFDIIKLQILSKDDSMTGEEWEEEKKRLDKIFFSQELNGIKRIGVNEYGNNA